MQRPSNPLAEIVINVMSKGACEVSLYEICDYYGMEPNLDAVQIVLNDLDQFKLKMLPSPLEQGDFTTKRLIVTQIEKELTKADIMSEVNDYESVDLEFKSSIFYDKKRAKNDPQAKIEDLKSDRVLHSALKTICGFLNKDGGRLFIGVSDARDMLGIMDDCRVLGFKNVDPDRWELWLRDKISTLFKEGNTINNYIDTRFFSFDAITISRIEIRRRRELSFVKKNNRYAFYSRQGNRTIEYQIDQILEYLEDRIGRKLI